MFDILEIIGYILLDYHVQSANSVDSSCFRVQNKELLSQVRNHLISHCSSSVGRIPVSFPMLGPVTIHNKLSIFLDINSVSELREILFETTAFYLFLVRSNRARAKNCLSAFVTYRI
jgi:hypothetical protein